MIFSLVALLIQQNPAQPRRPSPSPTGALRLRAGVDPARRIQKLAAGHGGLGRHRRRARGLGADYASAARDLLLPEQLPEDMVNSFRYRLLGGGKTWWAVRVFRQNVDRYPESVNVYDSYADGLVAAGDTAGAIERLRQAVAVGRRTGAAVAQETRDKLARLTAAWSHR
ncbi:MAG TPA: hypothetical protein VIW26_07085 [Gemmatimonadales bacterium]